MFLRVAIVAAASIVATFGVEGNHVPATAIGDGQANDWSHLLARGKRGALENVPDSVYKVDNHKYKKVANIKDGEGGLIVRVKDNTPGQIKEYALKLAEAKGTAVPLKAEADLLRKLVGVVGVPQIIYPPASAKDSYAKGTDGKTEYHWFVETLTGPDLTTLLVRGDPKNTYINAKQAVRILIKYEAALRGLHDRGFYHSDSHLSNFCIDYDDNKKGILVDFDNAGTFKLAEKFNTGKPSPYRDYRALTRAAALMMNMFFGKDKELQEAVQATSPQDFAVKFFAGLSKNAPKQAKDYTLEEMRTAYANDFQAFLKSLYPGAESEDSPLTTWTKAMNPPLKPVSVEEYKAFEAKKEKEFSA